MPLLETPDYDDAVQEFLRLAVEGLMSQADPIYASLRRVPWPEGVSRVRVEVGDASTTSPEIRISEAIEIQRSDVTAGNLEQLYDVLAQIAESHLQQFMRPFFDHVGDAAEAVGNTMTLQAATLDWDDLLDAWEKVEWAADAGGHVQPPQMLAGDAVLARLRQIPAMTEEQHQRAAAIAIKKQEGYVSRRRGRRLR